MFTSEWKSLNAAYIRLQTCNGIMVDRKMTQVLAVLPHSKKVLDSNYSPCSLGKEVLGLNWHAVAFYFLASCFALNSTFFTHMGCRELRFLCIVQTQLNLLRTGTI